MGALRRAGLPACLALMLPSGPPGDADELRRRGLKPPQAQALRRAMALVSAGAA